MPEPTAKRRLCSRENGYSLYVLLLLLITYLLNQLDRYLLPILTKPMAQELHYGDESCMINTSRTDLPSPLDSGNCTQFSASDNCTAYTYQSVSVCKWDYNGQGYEYQILAGPVFILVYTFVGVGLSALADLTNRKLVLAACLAFWSLATLLTGFTEAYWQVALTRFAIGMGESGCNPFATSLLADYFGPELRASAISVYNWGIYIGYSLAYAVGNSILIALGWRWVYIICGIPGIVFAFIILVSVKEPERSSSSANLSTTPRVNQSGETSTLLPPTETFCDKVLNVLRPFFSPTLLILCIAGSIRNGAGYVWAYNTQPYYISMHQTPEQIATYMSWIPLVGGALGVLLGGVISDRVVQKQGLRGRVLVLIASQILASPFAAGALFLPTPWAYISLIPTYVIGEAWVGVLLTVIVELVPGSVRTSAIAVYMFIISNIGGNMPLLVPLFQTAFAQTSLDSVAQLRASLYIMYPAMYVLASLLFALSLFAIKRDKDRVANRAADETPSSRDYRQVDGADEDDSPLTSLSSASGDKK